MPVMMSPGATALLRRLSGSSTRLTVAVISILICPQVALVGVQTTPTARASASGSPSFVKIPIRLRLTNCEDRSSEVVGETKFCRHTPFVVVDPDGTEQEDGGGSQFMLNTGPAVLPSTFH